MLDLIRRVLKRVLRVEDAPPEVPLGEQPEVFRASPRHLTYLLAIWALRTGFMTFVVGGAIGGACIGIVVEEKRPDIAIALASVTVAFLAVWAFIGYAAIRLDWEMRWYVLTDRSLRIREGIVFMREVTLTLANVQEIKVSQGPIQRALDLTDLVVDTAGGGVSSTKGGSVHGHHGILRGVDRGGDLRSKIETRVKQRRGAGLGDPDEHHDDEHHGAEGALSLVDALSAVRDEARRLREVATTART